MRATRALAAATLTVTAVAGGCARPGTTAEPSVVAAVPWQQTYAEIIEQMSGTPQQRQAGTDRQWYAWQAALGECMAGMGAPFELPAHTTPPATPNSLITPGELLAFAPRRTDFGLAASMVALAEAGEQDNPALLKTAGADREAWVAAQNACAPATARTEDLAVPGSQARVAEALDLLLLDVQNRAAPSLGADYMTCMSREGVPVSEGVASEARIAALNKYPPLSAAGANNPSSVPGWTEALAFEKKAAAADWKCRGPQVPRVQVAVGDKLAVFAEEHRDELARVAADWARMPAERDAAKAAAMKVVTK
ncbi:hypothetical protein [Paractinoplanes brasiliensis]|uniref:Lipoprotein n=1 Tax=Paractinoplanes brasiliensis TaxID=52695 RepID=A0A4R6JBP8_9ACTN|nr:hypothetical protein [Actinoplanes brasiliensis]TDO32962.1 hypothetical protein C8E87_8442 [Actinoplanes brasiliensis]GID28680.1 hypothetical protein Abr02nite_36630 [Actinoplanes brasiliensis]